MISLERDFERLQEGRGGESNGFVNTSILNMTFSFRSFESESVSSNSLKKTLVFHNLVPEKGETGKQFCVVFSV